MSDSSVSLTSLIVYLETELRDITDEIPGTRERLRNLLDRKVKLQADIKTLKEVEERLKVVTQVAHKPDNLL